MRQAPLRLRVGVELACAPSTPVQCGLLETLLKHVLFIHGQLPSPYDAIVKELASSAAQPVGRCRKTSRHRSMLRKARKLTETAEQLFQGLPAALQAVATAQHEAGPSDRPAPPLVAVFVIGSSPASPRVVIMARITHDSSVGKPGGAEAPTASELNGAKRKLVRVLMTLCGDLASVSVGLCRLHVLLQAPRAASLPALFKPRPALRLKLRRAHACCVDLGGPATAATPDAPMEGAPVPPWCEAPLEGLDPSEPRAGAGGVVGSGEYIWFQATSAAMRGFTV